MSQGPVRTDGPSLFATPIEAALRSKLVAVQIGAERPPVGRGVDSYERPSGSFEPTPIGELSPPIVKPDRPILLYNEACSVCRTISSWVIAEDDPTNGGGQLLDERAIGHDPAALEALHPGLDIWDAYAEIHVLMPDGTIKKGGEAITEVLKLLPATRWLAPAFDVEAFGFRPFQMILNGAYGLLDRLRPALGCESCGQGVPWWGKPVEWTVKAWKAITG